MGFCLVKTDVGYYTAVRHFVVSADYSTGMKDMILVPLTRSLTPCTVRLKLLAKEWIHCLCWDREDIGVNSRVNVFFCSNNYSSGNVVVFYH